MPRHLVVGNGHILVNLDNRAYIRDIYYPFVGEQNHLQGYPCRIGVWADGRFSWLEEEGWTFRLGYAEDSLVTQVTAVHAELGLTLEINDGVHQRDPVFLRKVTVHNHWDCEREIRLFFNQDLCINETEVGDTAVYYPANHSVFHYKKDRYFLFNGLAGGQGIHQFTTGVKRFHHAEGTWRDAEDGELMGNPIAQGSVDSTISLRLRTAAGAAGEAYYWMSIGRCLEDVLELDRYVRESGPGHLLDRVRIYWQRWTNKTERDFADLPESVSRQFKHSLLMVRTQTDNGGAIVAANDSDVMQFNRDHYSYMWPRDGALVAYAMTEAGYGGMVEPFYHFCRRGLSKEGYLHHKYNPDGTVGSSWHPYVSGGEEQLPIQEDETALVLFALWADYKRSGNLELSQSLYPDLIRKAASFLGGYMLEVLDLPKPSYDLWEERYGIFTFTCASVYAGLAAAANFASLFGDEARSTRYRRAAERVKTGMLKHLWNEEAGRFARGLYRQGGEWVQDMTLESSIYGIFAFGVLEADDPRVVSTMRAIREGLTAKTSVGGVARYFNDYYYQRSSDLANVPGNPWIICSLWVAEWEIAAARTADELAGARRTLEWAAARAMESGVLPEQVDPYDGSPLSVAPLTWSHATFVLVCVKYMEKAAQLTADRELETAGWRR
ncbi:glucan 1,3-alpha-glucosidase [Paenibacillus sp. J31TS4]|uniref:glycoside hydrolase family 15 protein n=1 Tax=Paenibacillus sp. J31TS4 TaxID=2807195 RepID=UPI001B275BFF|nr:glycoside hydrolase family 15 protein [Paenibacillus sp. J31TS4]GIP41432.1 glucan 1,3-alpha-glucosidase [Paenibacillus sp. J31TS4]